MSGRRIVVGQWRMLASFGLLPLCILFALNLVDKFDSVAFVVLLPEIKHAYHLSNSAIAVVFSLQTVVLLLLALPTGYLGDRTNRLWLSRWGALIWAAATLLLGFPIPLALIVVSRLAGGAGKVVNSDVHTSLLADYYPAEHLPLVISIHGLAAVAGVLIAAPLAAASIGWFHSLHTVFAVLALPTLVVVALSFALREPARGRFDAAPAPSKTASFGEAYRRLRAISTMRRIWIASFLLGSALIPLGALNSLFFQQIYGVGSVGRSRLVAAAVIAGAVGLVAGGQLARRAVTVDRHGLLIVGAGVALVGFGVTLLFKVLSPWLAGSIVMMALSNAFASAALPFYLTAVSMLAPGHMRTTALASSSAYLAFGGLFLAPIILASGQGHSLRFSIGFLSLFVIAGGAVAIPGGKSFEEDLKRAKTVDETAEERGDSQLVCAGLSGTYDSEPVLKNLDLTISKGSVLGVFGTNGAGKSTLLNLLSGALEPTAGSVFFEGIDVAHAAPRKRLLHGISYVPAEASLFPALTVRENLSAAGWQWRRRTNNAFSEAIQTVLQSLDGKSSVRAGDLSGGEQRLLALAMALVSEPRLLLVDEVSLGLSPAAGAAYRRALGSVAEQGTTIVIVEQSVEKGADMAGEAIFMEKGEIVFRGTPADLAQKPELTRAIFMPTKRTGARRRSRATTKGAAAALSFDHLTKRFDGVTAVDDVTFEVAQGEIVAIVGPNGAGKTSLLDLAGGFLEPDSGVVTLTGRDVTGSAPHERSQLGLYRSFQIPKLWVSLTVRESIATALERHLEFRSTMADLIPSFVREENKKTDYQVAELIELFNLKEFQDRFISELSTGVRRVVEMATLLAHCPSVALLDEPTSGLTPQEGETLSKLLLDTRDNIGCSMLLVEHDMPTVVSAADRVVALDRGRVIAQGAPERVLSDDAVIQSYGA